MSDSPNSTRNASEDDSCPSLHDRPPDGFYDGVYFVDRERRITYWSKSAEQLTGYPASEAVGRHCFDNFLMHVDSQGCPLCLSGCPLTVTIADGKRRETEMFLRHKLGHRIPVFVRVAPALSEAGRFVGASAVFSNLPAKS
jgi:PAS domain S-box-containing protein